LMLWSEEYMRYRDNFTTIAAAENSNIVMIILRIPGYALIGGQWTSGRPGVYS